MISANKDPEQIKGLRPKDPGFRCALITVLFAGLTPFRVFYAAQALPPALSSELSVDPATAALTVSATISSLTCAIILMPILSERFGRRRMIIISASVATLSGLVASIVPGIGSMTALRLLQGTIITGVPAVAIAYVSGEAHADHVSRMMGPYISGTAVGDLLGRIIPSIVLEFTSWRMAIVISMMVAFIFAVLAQYFLPQQRRFTPKQLSFAREG